MSFLDSQRTHTSIIGRLDDDVVTRALIAGALSMLAAFIVLLPPWFLDQRMVEGSDVWLKPQKFHVSLFVHFVTLALLAQLLPRAVRTGHSMRIFTYLALSSLVMETVYIVTQAARGRMSHFNYETPLEGILYLVMGVGAVLLVTLPIVMGGLIWRRGEASRGLKLGAILGLAIGGVLTLFIAGYMSSVNGSRWVGGVHPEGGAVIPFFGWSREVGDLRPAHFFALHMMQSLPIIGWLSDRVNGPSILIVASAAMLQIALSVGLFAWALAGNSI